MTSRTAVYLLSYYSLAAKHPANNVQQPQTRIEAVTFDDAAAINFPTMTSLRAALAANLSIAANDIHINAVHELGGVLTGYTDAVVPNLLRDDFLTPPVITSIAAQAVTAGLVTVSEGTLTVVGTGHIDLDPGTAPKLTGGAAAPQGVTYIDMIVDGKVVATFNVTAATGAIAASQTWVTPNVAAPTVYLAYFRSRNSNGNVSAPLGPVVITVNNV